MIDQFEIRIGGIISAKAKGRLAVGAATLIVLVALHFVLGDIIPGPAYSGHPEFHAEVRSRGR